MFGSTNSFGQSSSSPFGSQSVFGSNNASNNPFAPKPFGSTSPFGSQTGGSMFGGTSTGVFGATQSSSPMPSTPTFGSSSTPAFGSSVPAFGASSTPAFGSGSSPFGGSSAFGQKPAFGGFGSTPNQASPFGNTFQQTQSAFGSNLFGSSAPFGASSQPAFGSTSAPAFGMTSTPAFGATSQPFGATSTPAFGSTTTPAFGSSSTSAFGSTGTGAPAFGSGGAFGASSSPAFGSSTTSGFGASSTPAFGSSSTPLFGASSSAFGASSSPSFSFGSSPSFGQSNSAFGSSPFGTTPSPSPFGAQSSSFGSQVTTPSFGSSAFGQSTFGGQRGGSRVTAYSPTAEVDGGSSTQPAGKLESISAMTVYKEKSHEELRWEDYQLGDKGGPNSATQPAGFGTPAAQPNPFGGSSTSNPFGGSNTSNTFGGTNTFGNPSTNPFSSSTSSNPFGSKPSTFGTSGFGTSSTPFNSSPFGSSSSANPFGTNTSSTPSLFTTSTSAFGSSSSPSIFGAPSSSTAFGSSPSMFGSTSASGTTSPFASGLNYVNTQSAGLFQSTTPSLGQTTSPFGQTSSAFGQSTPSFGQTNIFSTPTTGFGFPSSSTPSLLPTNNQTSFSNPFQTAQPAQVAGAFSFNNFGQTQAVSSGFNSMPGGFGQGTQFQSPVVMQPPPASNPFGTLPAMPQMSIGRSGSPTVQYGISSMPVTEKPNPIRVSSLLTSRHISQRRNNSATRKYHPKNDGPKVPFYYDDEAPSNPKADALFIPRENPRALVIGPREKWPSKASLEKPSQFKDTDPVHKNDCLAENGSDRERIHLAEDKQRANGVHEDKSTQKPDSYITQNGHRSGDAASVHEHGTEIESVLPKLKHADYYTDPQIQELAAKERAEPGFCRHVKGFVVGRHGYGSIKFFGETDVRGLDLESIVQFNNREVIVYMDDSKKPPVGQGLNKPAEVTLLNVKCLDKKTGKQCTEGLRVEKYRDMLMKKAQDQGVEFISYDPRKGEWKFKVNHFSSYGLDVEDEVV